jgi:hypothetical protein
MTKHILFMALYMVLVLTVFVFAGEHIIPEAETQFKDKPESCCVAPGRDFTIQGEKLYYA